jgi:FAD/FMN-containing dehydrogenase
MNIAEEAGGENCFLIGLMADQVLGARGWYSPHWHDENETKTRAALETWPGRESYPATERTPRTHATCGTRAVPRGVAAR